MASKIWPTKKEIKEPTIIHKPCPKIDLNAACISLTPLAVCVCDHQTAGTSFGEIAQEVKVLIEEIKNIGMLINKISQGSECVAEEINKVTEFSNEMAGDTQSVSAASEEQSATMKEIAYSIGALNDVTAKLNAAVNYFKIK